MLNSVPGIEEDLNRLKRWTSCTPLVKPVRGGRCARARSPRRAGPGRAVAVAVAEAEARRGAARPAGRTGGARARARAHAHARPDVTCRCGAVRCGVARCDVMAILPLTAINRAIKRAIKSVIASPK